MYHAVGDEIWGYSDLFVSEAGMEEQLQKGVTVPSSAPMVFAQNPLYLPSSCFVRSGGK